MLKSVLQRIVTPDNTQAADLNIAGDVYMPKASGVGTGLAAMHSTANPIVLCLWEPVGLMQCNSTMFTI